MNDDKKQNIKNDELVTITKTTTTTEPLLTEGIDEEILPTTTTNIEASNITTTTSSNTTNKILTINNSTKNVFNNNKNNIIIKNSNIIMGSPPTQQQQQQQQNNDNDTNIINQLYLINNKNELLDPDPEKQQQEENKEEEEELSTVEELKEWENKITDVEEEEEVIVKKQLKEHEVFFDKQENEEEEELEGEILEKSAKEKKEKKEEEKKILNEANFNELNNSDVGTKQKTIIINNLDKKNVLDLLQQQQKQQIIPKKLIDNLLVQVESHEMESSSSSTTSSKSSSPTSSTTSLSSVHSITSTILQEKPSTKLIKDKNNKLLKVEPLKINLNREQIKTIIRKPTEIVQTPSPSLSGTTQSPKKIIIKPIVRTIPSSDGKSNEQQYNTIPKITIKSIINKTNNDYLLYNKIDDKLIQTPTTSNIETTSTATSTIINKNIVPPLVLTTHQIVTSPSPQQQQTFNPLSSSSVSTTVVNNLLTDSTGEEEEEEEDDDEEEYEGEVGDIEEEEEHIISTTTTTTVPSTTVVPSSVIPSTTTINNTFDIIPKIKIKVDTQNCTTIDNNGNGNLSGTILNSNSSNNILNYNWETEYNDKTQKMSIKKTQQNLDDFTNNKFKIITNKEKSSASILRSTPPPSQIPSSSTSSSVTTVQQPLIPKLTIKTTTTSTDNKLDTMLRTVSGSSSSGSGGGNNSGTSSPISKLKIKPIIKPNELTKFTIKTIESPNEIQNDSSIDTNELHQQNINEQIKKTNTSTTTIPKLIVKVTKDINDDKNNCNMPYVSLSKWKKTNDINMTLTSETIITEPIIPKMLIRSIKTIQDEPIIIPKVTIKSIINNHLIDGINNIDNDGINNNYNDILISPKVTLKPIPKPIDLTQPLEIVTNLNVLEKGIDSPRIVLKINKTPTTTISSTKTMTNCINDELLLNNKQQQQQQKLITTSGTSATTTTNTGNASSSGSGIHHNINELKRNSSKIHKKNKILIDDNDNCDDDDDDDDDNDNNEHESNKKMKLIKKIKIKKKNNKKILLSSESSSVVSSSSSSSSSELSPQNIIIQQQNDDALDVLNNSLNTKTKLEETQSNLTNILTNLHKSKKNDNKLIPTSLIPQTMLSTKSSINDINSYKRKTKVKRKKRSIDLKTTMLTESILIDDDDDDDIIKDITEIGLNNQISSDDDNDVIIIGEDYDNDDAEQIRKEIDPLTINIDDKDIDLNNIIKQQIDDTILIENKVTPVKRGRGRPRKIPLKTTTKTSTILKISPQNKLIQQSISSSSSPIIIIDENGCSLSKDNDQDKTIITTTKRKLETDNDNANDDDIKQNIAYVDNHAERIETEVKEVKPRFIRNPNDEDTSPTFHPTYRTPRGRGRGLRGSRRGRGSRGPRGIKHGNFTPNSLNDKMNDNVIWSTPDTTTKTSAIRKKFALSRITSTPVLQAFEEDTRMSGDMSQNQTAGRNIEFWTNEESQNSFMSSGSTTIEGEKKKPRGRMEVGDVEGKTDFTIDMIAEYEWPSQQSIDINSIRGRGEMYMIQEQVAEYLGVKSFKRKYPDLLRRSVEMEERNHLMEKGLVSEKMCDLGLTAVVAADILDIMFQDFHDKYEEYRKYYREKQTRDFSQKQKALKMEPIDKSQLARDKSLQSASEWNISFNKERKDNRRACMDLQNLIIQLPDSCRQKMFRPFNKTASDYPIALVPGQFSEYYKEYTPKELLCYPINTVLMNPSSLSDRIEVPTTINNIKTIMSDDDKDDDDDDDDDNDSTQSDTDSSNCSSDTDSMSGTGSDDSSSSDSSDEDDDDSIKCRVCDKSQNSNRDNKPECFVQCSSCRRKAHPSCIEMSPRMSKRASEYSWQCTECKQCCKCHRSTDEDKMLFCDQCDRGYHIYCIGLRMVPQGRWHCTLCSICTQCGTRNPEGHTNININIKQVAIVQWAHFYQHNHITKLREHSGMLCMPCARLKNDSEVR